MDSPNILSKKSYFIFFMGSKYGSEHLIQDKLDLDPLVSSFTPLPSSSTPLDF